MGNLKTNERIMNKETIITLPYLQAGLNGKDGLIREHFRSVKPKKNRLTWEIREQLGRGLIKYTGAVSVEYIRRTTRLMDWDNHCSSFKHIGDVLVSMGIIEDDNPSIIAVFNPRQEKVKHRKQHEMIIKIKPYKIQNETI